MTIQDTIHSDSTMTTGRVRERVEDTVSNLRSRLGHAVDVSKERVGVWKGDLEHGISDRPLQSVLIALGVGAALGVLLGRRLR